MITSPFTIMSLRAEREFAADDRRAQIDAELRDIIGENRNAIEQEAARLGHAALDEAEGQVDADGFPVVPDKAKAMVEVASFVQNFR